MGWGVGRANQWEESAFRKELNMQGFINVFSRLARTGQLVLTSGKNLLEWNFVKPGGQNLFEWNFVKPGRQLTRYFGQTITKGISVKQLIH